MSYVTTKDGTQIFYKDWGKGPVVTFSHGWPLNSDAWLPVCRSRSPRPWSFDANVCGQRHGYLRR